MYIYFYIYIYIYIYLFIFIYIYIYMNYICIHVCIVLGNHQQHISRKSSIKQWNWLITPKGKSSNKTHVNHGQNASYMVWPSHGPTDGFLGMAIFFWKKNMLLLWHICSKTIFSHFLQAWSSPIIISMSHNNVSRLAEPKPNSFQRSSFVKRTIADFGRPKWTSNLWVF